jgi:hypothetical protein
VPESSESQESPRAAVLLRFRDKQLADCLSTGVAALVAWGVAIAVRGSDGLLPTRGILLFFLLISALGMAMVLMGFFGDRSSCRAAVPLTDPDATTVPGRDGLHRITPRFAGVFVFEAASYTAVSLFLEDVAGVIFLFVIIPFVRSLWVAWWERRHGVLLWEPWEGEVRQSGRPVTRKDKEPQFELYTTPAAARGSLRQL